MSGQGEPVGREQAARELDLAVHNVSFHLDRLVTGGLLEVEYRRLSGKTGPGAGRPSKLYRRASREFAVSLPPRRYDLVGEILAAAVSQAAEGVPSGQALHDGAPHEGLSQGQVVEGLDRTEWLPALAQVLRSQGLSGARTRQMLCQGAGDIGNGTPRRPASTRFAVVTDGVESSVEVRLNRSCEERARCHQCLSRECHCASRRVPVTSRALTLMSSRAT